MAASVSFAVLATFSSASATSSSPPLPAAGGPLPCTAECSLATAASAARTTSVWAAVPALALLLFPPGSAVGGAVLPTLGSPTESCCSCCCCGCDCGVPRRSFCCCCCSACATACCAARRANCWKRLCRSCSCLAAAAAAASASLTTSAAAAAAAAALEAVSLRMRLAVAPSTAVTFSSFCTVLSTSLCARCSSLVASAFCRCRCLRPPPVVFSACTGGYVRGRGAAQSGAGLPGPRTSIQMYRQAGGIGLRAGRRGP